MLTYRLSPTIQTHIHWNAMNVSANGMRYMLKATVTIETWHIDTTRVEESVIRTGCIGTDQRYLHNDHVISPTPAHKCSVSVSSTIEALHAPFCP